MSEVRSLRLTRTRATRAVAAAAAATMLSAALPALVTTPAAAVPTNITWTAKPTALAFDEVFTLTATSLTGAVTYGSDTPATCTVVPAADLANATLTVASSSPGSNDCTFWAAEVNPDTSVGEHDIITVTVTKKTQSITFAELDDQLITTTAISLTATSDSSLAVSFSETSPACRLDSVTLYIEALGACEVTASQAGDDTYAAATDVVRSFDITNPRPRTPGNVAVAWDGSTATVTWDAPANDQPASITGYRVSVTPGDHHCTTDSVSATTCTISDLTIGTTYSFSVVATSDYDDSAPSTPHTPMQEFAISADGGAGCGVDVTHHAVCWGYNDYNRIIPPGDLGEVTQVAIGLQSACALLTDNTVRCWGNTQYPGVPDGLDNVVSLYGTLWEFCAVTDTAQLRCWGTDSRGFTPPGDLGPVKSVVSGDLGMCAILTSDRFRCWGQERSWASWSDITAGNTPEVRSVSVGWESVCAVLMSGELTCWGREDTQEMRYPRGIHNAVAVSQASYIGCYVTSDNQGSCWGQGPSEYAPLREPRSVTAVRTGSGTACFTYSNLVVSCLPTWAWAGLIPASMSRGSMSASITKPAAPANVVSLRADQSALVSFDAAPATTAAPIDFYRVLTVGYGNFCDVPADAATLSCVVHGLANGRVYSFKVVAVNAAGMSSATQSVRAVTLAHSRSGDRICIITAEHVMRCWAQQVVGDEDSTAVLLTSVAQVAMARDAVCALRMNGSVTCLGTGWGSSPPAGLPPLTSLVASDYAVCGTTAGGAVRCWGYEGFGEQAVPAEAVNVTKLRPGRYSMCAIKSDGSVVCWGMANMPPGDLPAVSDLATVDHDTCAILTSGALRCWGEDAGGIVSLAPTTGSYTGVALGTYNACAIDSTSHVVCWGRDAAGTSAVPGDLGTVSAIVASLEESFCALQTGGTIQCWGNFYDYFEQPGDAFARPGAAPSPPQHVGATYDPRGMRVSWLPPADNGGYDVTGYRVFTEPATSECTTGADIRTCVLTSGLVPGTTYDVRVEAINDVGNSLPSAALPLPRIYMSEWGSGRTCSTDSAQFLMCFGNNDWGKSDVPSDLGPVKDVALQAHATCAQLEDDTVRCWGRNEGQITVPGDLGPVKKLIRGWDGACAINADDLLVCWGNLTQPPIDLGPVIDAAVGYYETCAVLEDHTLRCWGDRGYIEANQPELTGVIAAGVNENFMCAMLDDGSVTCWSDVERHTFATTDAVDLQMTNNGACVLTGSGTVECYGSNPYGRFDFGQFNSHVTRVTMTNDVTCLDYSLAPFRRCFGSPGGFEEISYDQRYGSRVTYATPPRAPADALLIQGRRSVTVRVTASPSDGGSALTGYTVTLRGASQGCTIPPEAMPLECTINFLANGRTYHADVVAQNLVGTSRKARELLATQVRSGGDKSCAVTVTGGVVCWSPGGEPGWETPAGLGTVVDASTTYHGACALLADTTVRCWGPDLQWVTPPSTMNGTVLLRGGPYHFCAVGSVGEVTCWGRDWSTVPEDLPPAQDVSPLDNGACALLLDGSLRCWGSYEFDPSVVPPLSHVSATQWQVCGIDLSGVAGCWGPDWSGVVSQVPVVDQEAVQISLGYLSACARYADGTVRCWGNADYGRTALNPSDGPFIDVLAGRDAFSCGVHTDNVIQCVGYPDYRVEPLPDVAGTPGAPPRAPTNLRAANEGSGTRVSWDAPVLDGGFPVTRYLVTAEPGGATCTVDAKRNPYLTSCVVLGLTPGETYTFSVVAANIVGSSPPAVSRRTPVHISVGADAGYETSAACAVMSDASVECWGFDRFGNTDVPDNLPPAVKVAASGFFSCALLVSGDVECWGGSGYGTLAAPPLSLGTVVDLQASAYAMCALSDTGDVTCWGSDDWSVVSGSRNLPQPVARMDISVQSACVVYVDSTFHCWGNAQAAPAGVTLVKEASSSPWVTCVILLDDTLSCSGSDGWDSIPPELPAVTDLQIGLASVCVLRASDDQAMCWGWMFDEQRGVLQLVGDGPAQQVETGWRSGCVLTKASVLTCFGTHDPAELRATLPPTLADPVSLTAYSGPSQPHVRSVVRDLTNATITWDPPASDGGSPVTGTYAIAHPGNRVCFGQENEGVFSCTIGSLNPDIDYEFDAFAANEWGNSSYLLYPQPADGQVGVYVPIAARASDGRPVELSAEGDGACESSDETVAALAAGDCTVTASAFGLESEARTFVVDPAHRDRPGLRLRIYEGLFRDNESDLVDDRVTACFDGRVSNLEFPHFNPSTFSQCRDEDFAAHFSGTLRWPGDYDGTTLSTVVFRALTDDGSRLAIDGRRVFYDGGYHGEEGPASGPLRFLAGSLHTVDFWQFQGGGGSVAKLRWDNGTGGDFNEVIPSSAFGTVDLTKPKSANRLRWLGGVTLRDTVVDGDQISITAVSSVGAPVTYAIGDGSDCELNDDGFTVTITGSSRPCTLVAQSAEDDYSLAAADITHSWYTVNGQGKRTPIVTWPTASSIAHGQPLSASTLTGGSANCSGSFAFTSPATIPPAGTADYQVSFTPSDTDTYAGLASGVSVTVTESNPHIATAPTASQLTYGQTLADATLTGGVATVSVASSDVVAGTFTFDSPSTAPSAGTQDFAVTFTPDDSSTWSAVALTVSVTTVKADPVVYEGPTSTSLTWGQTLADATLSGGSTSVPGSFAFTSPSTTPDVGDNGVGVTFTPTDSANYNTATTGTTVTVGKAHPTVATPPSASSVSYPAVAGDSTLSGGSAVASVGGSETAVAGSFSITSPSDSLDIGDNTVGVTFTPTDTDHFAEVEFSVTVHMAKGVPLVTSWPIPGAVSVGQVLSDSTLYYGSASVPGSFAWASPSAAVHAGTSSHTIVFTPTDSSHYDSVTSSGTIVVDKATPVIDTPPTASSVQYGNSLYDATLSGGHASVPGAFAFLPGQSLIMGANSIDVLFTPENITDYVTVTFSIAVTQVRATPRIITKPVSSVLKPRQPLGRSRLTQGAAQVAGSFTWLDSSLVPADGVTLQQVSFAPNDADHYASVVFTVPVVVMSEAAIQELARKTFTVRGSMAPGYTVRISTPGYSAGETVVIAIASTPQVLAQVRANSRGVVSAAVTLPTNLKPGRHRLVMFSLSSGRGFQMPVTVSAAGSASSPTPTANATELPAESPSAEPVPTAEPTPTPVAPPAGGGGGAQALVLLLIVVVVVLAVRSRRR